MNIRMSRAETRILRLFPCDGLTLTEIADKSRTGISQASRSVTHLAELGLLEKQNTGKAVQISLSTTTLGNRIATLLVEEPGINMYRLLGGYSLRILPLLLETGYSSKELALRSGIPVRSVQLKLRDWLAMGTVQKKNRRYFLNMNNTFINEFIREFNHFRNLQHLREHVASGSLIWEDRDEYLLSTSIEVKENGFLPAASTWLSENDYDIVPRNNYYLFSPVRKEIPLHEALAQAMLTNPGDPRIVRLVKEAIKKKTIRIENLEEYLKRYIFRNDLAMGMLLENG